jgi:hypothetical protein
MPQRGATRVETRWILVSCARRSARQGLLAAGVFEAGEMRPGRPYRVTLSTDKGRSQPNCRARDRLRNGGIHSSEIGPALVREPITTQSDCSA